MSKASVEQALMGLVPALNGPLPPELIDLAFSLLARSRSVAHSLKADEEIARPTKKRFNLPTIVSRPPCPPRIYKKLYNYLSSALPASDTTREPQTPRKQRANPATDSAARATPKTPVTGTRTPHSTTKSAAADDMPDWVMAAIRKLVRAFAYPSAAPHVFSGVESTLPLLARMSVPAAETPSQRGGASRVPVKAASAPLRALSDCRIRGLIIVIFLYTFSRMKNVEVVPEDYSVWRRTAIDTMLDMATAEEITYADLSLEADELMPLAKTEGWLNMQWYLNVMPLQHDEDAIMQGIEVSGPVKKSAVATWGASDYIGLGTMMQDATDYLGDRRREDFANWKEKIMARVREIQAS
ncbi:hypothetical protein ACEQ8H_007427 [Pleosporales sp. CAS-2024a]